MKEAIDIIYWIYSFQLNCEIRNSVKCIIKSS